MDLTKVLPNAVPRTTGIISNLDNPENPSSFSNVLEEDFFSMLFLSLSNYSPKQEGQSFEELKETLNEINLNVNTLNFLQSENKISKDAYLQKVTEYISPKTTNTLQELDVPVDISRMIIPVHPKGLSQKGDGFNNIINYLNALAGKIVETPAQSIQPSNNIELLQKIQLLIDNEPINQTQPIVNEGEDTKVIITTDKLTSQPLKEGNRQESLFLMQESNLQQPKAVETKGSLAESHDELDIKMTMPISNEVTHKQVESQSKVHIENIFNQVAQGIRHSVLTTSSQVKKLNIQLNPAELGNIEISLRWQDGQVHMNFKASEVATHNNLQNNFSVLRDALEGMGVSCGSMEMGFSEGNSQSHQPQQKNAFKAKDLEVNTTEDFSLQFVPKTLNDKTQSIINITV